MLESDADRLAMLQALDGELAQIDERNVLVIFTDEHVPLQMGAFIADGSSPQIMARASDLNVNDNSQIVVRGVEYRVAAVEPDGVNGLTTVRLRKA